MLDLKDRTIVSNGNHSDTIFEGLKRGESFISSLKSEKHEMDHPNYTPRIAGLLEQSKSIVSLIKISKSDFSFEHSSLQYFRYPLIFIISFPSFIRALALALIAKVIEGFRATPR